MFLDFFMQDSNIDNIWIYILVMYINYSRNIYAFIIIILCQNLTVDGLQVIKFLIIGVIVVIDKGNSLSRLEKLCII